MTAPHPGAIRFLKNPLRVAGLGLLLSACGGREVKPGMAEFDHRDAAAAGSTAASGGAFTGGLGGTQSGTGAGPQEGAGGDRFVLGPTPGCSGSPDPGMCPDKVSRFYYEASSGICRPFTYTGCGGNENNFMTLEGCQSYCVNRRSCSCSGTQTTCTVNRECSECPLDLDKANGTTCTMDGLRCAGASSALCNCVAAGDGTASWICGRKVL